jgi:hypothetical protein
MLHGLELERLFHLWGTPVYPAEPASQAVARLQREIDALTIDLIALYDLPDASDIVDTLEEARQIAWGLMTEYNGQLRPTEYSRARTADEYVALMLPRVVEPTSGKVDYAAIKERIDIVDYISRHSEIKKRGRAYLASCPGHDDKHPSLHIYPDSRSWYCYVCMTGGDIFDYEALRVGAPKALPLE